MYIIQGTADIHSITCLQEVPKDIEKIQILYKKLDGRDVTVKKSYYPRAFIKTLDFKDNVLRTTNKDLHQRFKKWLYVTTKENGRKAYFTTKYALCNSKQFAKNKVRSLYNYGVLCIHLPAITSTFYSTMYRYMSLLKNEKSNDEHVNLENKVTVDKPEESISEQPGFQKSFPSSLNIEEMLANLETKGIDEIQKDISKLSNILTGINIPGLDLPSLDIPPPTVDEESVVQHTTLQHTTHQQTTQTLDILDALDTDVSGLIDNKTDICDGYTVFRHKKNRNVVYASIEYMEDKAIDKVNQISHLPEKFNIVLKTYNKNTCKYNISCLDETYWQDIQDLVSIGLENVEIKDVIFFEPMSKLDGIVQVIQSSTEDANKYIHSIYNLRKFLCSRPEQGKVIKKVIESIYTKYEFDFKKQVSLKNLYLEYKKYCGMIPDVLDYERYCKVMVYLGFNIKEGDVLYMKKRMEPLEISIPSFKQNVDNSMIIKRNLQLRSEPPVNLVPNVSPWQMSPLI